MWLIPVFLGVMVLVPSALFAACSAHDAAEHRAERTPPRG
jgi:hypothetical protein